MSDLEDSAGNFLQRWSQRKRAADKLEPERVDSSAEDKEAGTNPAAQSEADPPAFDPATLPPIESITATSDIRAFLAHGVPEELTRAALRRVWVTDPMIRDFIGIADNQWDFTKPDSMPGFGSLELTPELRRIVAGLVGEAPGQATEQQANAERTEQIAKIPEQPPPRTTTLEPGGDDSSAERSPARTDFAHDSDNASEVKKGTGSVGENPGSPRRKHGGAVPKLCPVTSGETDS